MNVASILASTVIAAVVAGMVSVFSTERRIKVENITQERAKWRDRIRKKALRVERSVMERRVGELKRLRLDFALNLNPHDPEDKAILFVISDLARIAASLEIGDTTSIDTKLQEFTDRVALLLKHDWDKAKSEADPTSTGYARRVSYLEFKAANPQMSEFPLRALETKTVIKTNGQKP
jgi:hypothetical protein